MKKFLPFLFILFIATSFTVSDGYKPGDNATDFKLKNVDGKMLSLSDYKNVKGFIVVFTCNHCPFAKAYENRIIDLHKKFASKGYPVVAISSNDPNREPDDSYENMVVRAKEKSYPFPYLFDESQEIARAYGATRTPHVFVLSKNGKNLQVEYIGAIDDNTYEPENVKTRYVEDAVDNLLAGKKISTPVTKAVGCTIKWKKTE